LYLSISKLKTLRQEKGWSQEVVAKASGLSVRTIQRIEADGKASAESALAIASVFDLSPKKLQATSSEIEVNWTRKMIVKNSIALFIILGVVAMLVHFGANELFFVDVPTLLYLILFLSAATIISFGTDGLFKSVAGLKYLFTDEMEGGASAQYLAKIFQSQIKFAYGGSLLGIVIGVISMHAEVSEYSLDALHKGYAVNLLVLFFATLLSEGILRPLSVKLETCDMKQ